MVARRGGTLINVAEMLEFGATVPLGRAICVAALSHLVSISLALHEELGSADLCALEGEMLCAPKVENATLLAARYL